MRRRRRAQAVAHRGAHDLEAARHLGNDRPLVEVRAARLRTPAPPARASHPRSPASASISSADSNNGRPLFTSARGGSSRMARTPRTARTPDRALRGERRDPRHHQQAAFRPLEALSISSTDAAPDRTGVKAPLPPSTPTSISVAVGLAGQADRPSIDACHFDGATADRLGAQPGERAVGRRQVDVHRVRDGRPRRAARPRTTARGPLPPPRPALRRTARR